MRAVIQHVPGVLQALFQRPANPAEVDLSERSFLEWSVTCGQAEFWADALFLNRLSVLTQQPRSPSAGPNCTICRCRCPCSSRRAKVLLEAIPAGRAHCFRVGQGDLTHLYLACAEFLEIASQRSKPKSSATCPANGRSSESVSRTAIRPAPRIKARANTRASVQCRPTAHGR